MSRASIKNLPSEFAAIESQWNNLDDNTIIKDVLFKGKYISNAIKFISERNQISIEEAKKNFYEVCEIIVKSLIQNKQLYRASHILKNAQFNELHYLYDLYEKCSQPEVKELIIDYLKKIDEHFNENIIRAYYVCFSFLQENILKHSKYLEVINQNYSSNVITSSNIKNINFCTFMKHLTTWKNEICVDIFFKSKKDSRNLELLPILDKTSFFNYIIQNELNSLLRKWLNEQYLCRAGKSIPSTSFAPNSFDDVLNFLFRKWSFETSMMDKIPRREKDVIKNEFAKIGLFENRESKSICRKLNRFFTTHTFHENFLSSHKDEITEFIIENKLTDLLGEKFINQEHIKTLNYKENILMDHELKLLESTSNMFNDRTDLDDFVSRVNMTTEYIQKFNKSFERNDLKLINQCTDALDLQKLAENHEFFKILQLKLCTLEQAPAVEQLLENYHFIDINFIVDEFECYDKDYVPNFNDSPMTKVLGENYSLNYLNYIQLYQGTFSTVLFITKIIENSMAISSSEIMNGCEEVKNIIMQNHENKQLLSHGMAFLETFSIDTSYLRCFVHLWKIKKDNDLLKFEKYLNNFIKMSNSEVDLKNVESLETFWRMEKFKHPLRSYLNKYTDLEDWFRIVLIAQYFNYSLESFTSICQERIKNSTLCDNLIRAVNYDSSDKNRSNSVVKHRNQIASTVVDSKEIFSDGKFLNSNYDLFAILLKYNDNISKTDQTFEEFQKYLQKSKDIDDLLYIARKYEWPVISVLAATTKLYQLKFCWLMWLILSSNYYFDVNFETYEELAMDVVLECIRIGFLKTLDESVFIFYPNSALKNFTTFLLETKRGNFLDMEIKIKSFIIELNNSDFNMVFLDERTELMSFIMKCFILHLKHNIKYSSQQQKYLSCLHRSGVSQFCDTYDFGLLKDLCRILEKTNVKINFEILKKPKNDEEPKEIVRIFDELIQTDCFEASIQIANRLNIPKKNLVLKWWLHMYRSDCEKKIPFDIDRYMVYMTAYQVNKETFIQFLSEVAENIDDCIEKYKIMIFILRNTCKKTAIELDELEYEIIRLYIRLKTETNVDTEIQPLTSIYFDNVIKKDKSLIHDSLYELKLIANIDELTISGRNLINQEEIDELDKLILLLLDYCDIVQTFRIQEMFGQAPEDFKILVYMLSISEGITSIYDLSKQERQLINSYAFTSNRFQRLTFQASFRTSSNMFNYTPTNSIQKDQNFSTNFTDSISPSMISSDLNESFIVDEPNRYQENKETVLALEGLMCKLTHGIKCGQRIALMYRTSLHLNGNFTELMKVKDPFELLELVLSLECESKTTVLSYIFDAMNMKDYEIAEFLSKELTTSIIKTRFYQFNRETETASSPTSSSRSGENICVFSVTNDLRLVLELCKRKGTMLGNYMLKYYKVLSQITADIPLKTDDDELKRICENLNRGISPQVLSLKKRNIIRVELLITAHNCFCYECSTEGIGEVLKISKTLINALAEKKSFNLVVMLLCGIARYREMFYCFDILIKNEAFESLLGQFNDKNSKGLKTAIISYLKEHQPNNKEYFKMAASHFLMYSELAKFWKTNSLEKIHQVLEKNQIKMTKSARINSNQLQKIEIPYLKCTQNILVLLNDALSDMVHATEMLTIDNKIEASLKLAAFCELVAMQIHLVKIGLERESKLCSCVLHQEKNRRKLQLISQYFCNYELSVPQMLILNKNIDNKVDYSKVIFCRSLIAEDESYLLEFIGRIELTDAIIENVVKITQFENVTKKQEKVLHDLVMMVVDCGLKFRLASLLGLKGLLQKMLNDEQSYYYLLDTKYGNIKIL